MKSRIAVCAVLLAGLVAVELFASGRTGIYGIVERVVFESDGSLPDRVQVWGAFALVERAEQVRDGLTRPTVVEDQVFTNYVFEEPTRGYLYFTLPETESETQNARREWADLASVAGTGQAVAFGYADRYRGDARMRVRDGSESPANPDPYYTDVGVAKLRSEGNHAGIVSGLRQLLEE
jgi:hypothetical protein